jgi:hypothetical protein
MAHANWDSVTECADLGFAVAFNSVEGQEFHILLILLIMIFTIFFCHSLVRTCMLVSRVAKHGSALRRVPSTVGPLGYAQPERPIHIVLARDEEIAAENHETGRRKVAPPPPAYGLWRSSVVSVLIAPKIHSKECLYRRYSTLSSDICANKQTCRG